MERVETALFVVVLLWTIWLIVKSFDNLIDNYVTIILLYIQTFYFRKRK